VFGPVAAVNTFHDLDEAAALASDTEYALSLGIPTADVSKALALADGSRPVSCTSTTRRSTTRRSPRSAAGGASGTGARFGGPAANIEAFTDTQWLTMHGTINQ
jgi:benzaldehyde dehydrogenase (NAD)